MEKISLAGTLIASGLKGAFALSLLAVLLTGLFAPHAFNDGLSIMLFVFTFPLGWLTGAVIGAAIAFSNIEVEKSRSQLLLSVVAIISGLFIMPILGPVVMVFVLMPVGFVIELFNR